MVDHITVGEEDNGAVGGEEDQNMPNSMQIWETNLCPVWTEEPVVDPGCESHADDANASLTKVNDSPVLLLLQLH